MRKGLDLVHPLDGGGVVSGGLAADPGRLHLVGEISCFEMTTDYSILNFNATLHICIFSLSVLKKMAE
jgi:hypothetical protein